jgi:hypothetical protein
MFRRQPRRRGPACQRCLLAKRRLSHPGARVVPLTICSARPVDNRSDRGRRRMDRAMSDALDPGLAALEARKASVRCVNPAEHALSEADPERPARQAMGEPGQIVERAEPGAEQGGHLGREQVAVGAKAKWRQHAREGRHDHRIHRSRHDGRADRRPPATGRPRPDGAQPDAGESGRADRGRCTLGRDTSGRRRRDKSDVHDGRWPG